MRNRKIITSVLIAALLISTACSPPANPSASLASVPSDTSNAMPEMGAAALVPVPIQPDTSATYMPEPEYFVPESDTVVIGRVTEGLPEFQIDQSVYREWVVDVESYVVKPLAENTLKIRIMEKSGIMPVKGVHLNEGEQLLAFLKIENDHFIFTGGLMGAKFLIENNRARYALYAFSPWESLDEVINRVEKVAGTWINERLTGERQAQINNIALSDPGIKDFLSDKSYAMSPAAPYMVDTLPEEIRYAVNINIPQQQQPELQLSVVVNVTRGKVDRNRVNIFRTELTETEKNAALQIALADPTVRNLIGQRDYQIANIFRDSWQEIQDGKTVFYIFPEVEIWLQPTLSNNLLIYVDLENKKAVKIFTESYLSPSPLESTVSDRDFKLEVSIPETDYRVGESVEAVITMTYSGEKPVELTAPDGRYFDLLVRDDQNNIIYQWERKKFGYPPSSLTPVKEIITLGQTITSRLKFSLPEAGTFYIRGRNFGGWDYGEVLAIYPEGSGYGLHLESPYMVVKAY